MKIFQSTHRISYCQRQLETSFQIIPVLLTIYIYSAVDSRILAKFNCIWNPNIGMNEIRESNIWWSQIKAIDENHF